MCVRVCVRASVSACVRECMCMIIITVTLYLIENLPIHVYKDGIKHIIKNCFELGHIEYYKWIGHHNCWQCEIIKVDQLNGD